MNKNILKHIIRYLLMICIVIVCCTIFRFSSDQSTESSRTSVGVTKFIVSIIWQDNPEVNTDTLINTIHPIIRKVAHFSIYLLLGTLVMCCAQTFKGCKEYKFDASVMLCFFYACTDEFHQLFVPGRSGEFTDVCLDTVGATFGILLVMIIVWIVEKIKNRNSNKPKQLAEKNEETGLKRKVMFIASTGGHLNELMQIKPLFKKFDYHIVTEKTKVDDSFKEEYKDKISTDCKEGYLTEDGLVMGTSGYVVDVEESYSRMQGLEFNKDLLVFKEIKCKVNTKNTKDTHIIKGNESKNMISIFIKVNDLSHIEEITNKFNSNNIKINIITNGVTLEKNIDLFKKIYMKGNKIVYNGTSESDLDKFTDVLSSFNVNEKTYCIVLSSNETLKHCKEKKLNTLKAKYIFTKEVYHNTLVNLDKGNFYVYKENTLINDEINPLIKYIQAKNISIVDIEELLK